MIYTAYEVRGGAGAVFQFSKLDSGESASKLAGTYFPQYCGRSRSSETRGKCVIYDETGRMVRPRIA